jgi:DNA primase
MNTIDTTTINRQTDLPSVIARHSELRRASGTEWQGPCPKCGGKDRLHVKQDFWFCRHCYPHDNGQPHDAIAFMRWMHGASFREAVQMLDPTATLPASTPVKPSQTFTSKPASWDEATVTQHVNACIAALPDSAGEEYLQGRGFLPDTIAAFRFGYDTTRNAISMPWYRGGKLMGVRYRLLKPPAKQKIVSEPGSSFTGYVYGGHVIEQPVLPEWNAKCTLVLVEGELNAASIWQVTRDMRVDVLSLGSESASVPDVLVGIAAGYRARIVWMDKREKAEFNAKKLTAAACWSDTEAGKHDANDFLKSNQLWQVMGHRIWHATPKAHQEALGFDLYDAGLGGYR